MFMVSEQALGSGLCITAGAIPTSWEAALHRQCQQVALLDPRVRGEMGQSMLSYKYLILYSFSCGSEFQYIGKKDKYLHFLLSTFRHVLLDTQDLKVKSEVMWKS